MKHILVGTNRKDSRSASVAKQVQEIHQSLGETYEIINLQQLPLHELPWGVYGEEIQHPQIKEAIEAINSSEGVVIICPEYNGSFPGALKYFIDYWKYPDAFEFRPFCLIGLGGRFGGLRPVEHLQQVLGYRNAHIYPQRVFIVNVWDQMDQEGRLTSQETLGLLKEQAKGFNRFIRKILL
ncbi:MAG: NAD(P)H-dependent oxidoreductase [Bdellovibrio sp.]|nr:MAG: NAD(P)H-dependent oxidoreductase [Bdellovibrio sp.]